VVVVLVVAVHHLPQVQQARQIQAAAAVAVPIVAMVQTAVQV
jgi:hypothetical protein